MEYDESIGPENEEREYKQGVIYWSKEYEFEYCLHLLKTGKWVFNKCIMNTIKIYLDKYLSKYITAFNHHKSNVKEGTLYIGIDDDGYVKGIPFKGDLNLNKIDKAINNIFNTLLFFKNKKVASEIRKSLKVEIIPVKYTNEKVNIDHYEFFMTEYEKRLKLYEIYKRKKFKWENFMRTQTEKLFILMNRERFGFLDWLDSTREITKSNYKHCYSSLEYLCDVPDYYDFRATIRIKNFKHLKGEIIKDFVNEQGKSAHYKELNTVMAMYKFGRYKDHCIGVFKNMKPNNPKVYINLSQPLFLLSQIDNMVPLWLNNNSDVKLYVIKITIPNKNKYVLYFNEKRGTYETCFRSINKTGPITVIC